jgi:hypothetical protein
MMEELLKEAMQQIKGLTPRLNKVTDMANEVTRHVELFLNHEMSVGVPAEVAIGSPGEQTESLVYARVNGKFRIAVVVLDKATGNEVMFKPWADCTREIKLRSFRYLPLLMTKLASEIAQQLAEVEEAAVQVAEVLASILDPGAAKRERCQGQS